MKKLINPIVLAGFIYRLVIHVFRHHIIGVMIFIVSCFLIVLFITLSIDISRELIETRKEVKEELEQFSTIQDAHNAASIGDIILVPDGTYDDSPLTGRDNAIQYLDSDGNGFLMYIGATGPIVECVTGFGTEDEAPCKD